MIKYDIHFYTAATRRYGEFILEILKHELNRSHHPEDQSIAPDEKLKKGKQIDVSLSRNRLITRDDKHRFSEGVEISKSEAELENYRRAERIVLS